ncbi:MAG: TRAP transporter large permease subunit [Deltaproteobacteria bacterium]
MIAAALGLLALFGLPLFVVISALALLAFHSIGVDLSAVIIEMSRLSNTPMLISLPLFIFMGILLAESKAPDRLLALSDRYLSWMPGGMAVVSLLLCAIFTAFTGASGITIFALGGLLYPALIADRYQERFSLGLLTTGGSLGLLFPPSLPIILFGVISETSVDTLFKAGIIPGTLTLVILGFYCLFASRKNSVNKSNPTPRTVGKHQGMYWEFPLPFIVLGGIYGGLLVVGEAAAVAALYALVVEVIILRDIPWRRLPAIVIKSMTLFGGILVILAASMATTNFLVDQQIPNQLFNIISRYITSKYTFLILLNIFLLAVGAMLDIFSATVLVVPLIVPVAVAYHVNLIHLGIIFLTNLQIGYCTPPVGLNLFLASYRFNKPIPELYRACLPFLFLLLLCLGLITFFPSLSLFLTGTRI